MFTIQELDQQGYIDLKMLNAYVDFLALEREQTRSFGFKDMPNGGRTVALLSRSLAFEQKKNVWTNLNPMKDPKAKGSIADVLEIRNIAYEYECPACPAFAIEVEKRVRRDLQMKVVTRYYGTGETVLPKNLPLIHSGAGPHTVINIVPIVPKDASDAELYNKAISKVLHTYVSPLVKKYTEEVNYEWKTYYELSFTTCGIERVLSAPGDWRFHTDKEDDCEELQGRVLRTVIDGDLVRNEWCPMNWLIQQAYIDVRDKRRNTYEEVELTGEEVELIQKYMPYVHDRKSKDTQEIIEDWVDQYIRNKRAWHQIPKASHGGEDRSFIFGNTLNQLANVLYNLGIDRYAEIAYCFGCMINEKAGDKYRDQDVERETSRVLDKFTPTVSKNSRRNTVESMLNTIVEEEKKEPNIITCTEEQEKFFVHFLDHCTIKNSESNVEKDEFVKAYSQFCEDHSQEALSERLITRLMKKYEYDVDRKNVDGKKVKYYIGIQLVTSCAVEEEAEVEQQLADAVSSACLENEKMVYTVYTPSNNPQFDVLNNVVREQISEIVNVLSLESNHNTS